MARSQLLFLGECLDLNGDVWKDGNWTFTENTPFFPLESGLKLCATESNGDSKVHLIILAFGAKLALQRVFEVREVRCQYA